MKEMFNHYYDTVNWCTNLEVINSLRKNYDEIKTVDERPNPNRRCKNYPLRTFEYKDFRFVETLNNRAGGCGDIYYTPTDELIAADTVFYNFHTFVWWFYNRR